MNRIGIATLLAFLGLGLAAPDGAWSMGGADRTPTAALSTAERRAWSELLDEGEAAGIREDRLEAAAARLQAAGISPDAARPAFAPAFQAARSGLPADRVLLKVEEGALKGAPPGALADAARVRLEKLEEARDLVAGSGRSATPESAGGLVNATALALESGVSGEALAGALERGRGHPAGQLQAVVEAGEALHLDGFDAETVEALMLDALERNLRRSEVIRMVRFASQKRGEGMGGIAVRQSLWGSDGQGPAAGAGAGMGGSGEGGGAMSGTGGGPGMGGGGPVMGGPGGGPGGMRPSRGGPR